MSGQIVCARCGKILNDWDLSKGHECSRFYYGRWEIREEEAAVWMPDDADAAENDPGVTDEDPPRLLECPHCHRVSLGFNTILLMWECLNTECRARVANDDIQA